MLVVEKLFPLWASGHLFSADKSRRCEASQLIFSVLLASMDDREEILRVILSGKNQLVIQRGEWILFLSYLNMSTWSFHSPHLIACYILFLYYSIRVNLVSDMHTNYSHRIIRSNGSENRVAILLCLQKIQRHKSIIFIVNRHTVPTFFLLEI